MKVLPGSAGRDFVPETFGCAAFYGMISHGVADVAAIIIIVVTKRKWISQ